MVAIIEKNMTGTLEDTLAVYGCGINLMSERSQTFQVEVYLADKTFFLLFLKKN